MKWNFLYQITAASRTPDWGATPSDPRSLCPLSSTEFVEPPHPKKIPGYAIVLGVHFLRTVNTLFIVIDCTIIKTRVMLRAHLLLI